MARHVDPLNALLSKARATKGRQKGDKRATKGPHGLGARFLKRHARLQPGQPSVSAWGCHACPIVRSRRALARR